MNDTKSKELPMDVVDTILKFQNPKDICRTILSKTTSTHLIGVQENTLRNYIIRKFDPDSITGYINELYLTTI
jgi:hypothetical protein